jgi:hypothetical protein
MLRMAEARAAEIEIDPRKETRLEQLTKEDFQRTIMSLPRDALRSHLLGACPELDEKTLEETLREIERIKEYDPLAVLQDNSLADGEKGGQYNLMKLAPNFEMAMYIAQATGSSIVTDNLFRWKEIRRAIYQRSRETSPYLSALTRDIRSSTFAFPQNVTDIGMLASDKAFSAYPALMRGVFKYLLTLGVHGTKPNLEAHLTARFRQAHSQAQTTIKKMRIPVKKARISCAFPVAGIQDNTVNRLLLMSSSERHLPSVPMAFFIEASQEDDL